MRLSNFFNTENKDRTLMIKGLPWKAQTKDLISHFKEVGTLEEKDVKIENWHGQNTGFALVTFEDEKQA